MSQGNSTYGFDYVPKTTTSPCAVVINEREVDIVRWMFGCYANGAASTPRPLEERGEPTKHGKKLWRTENVR